MAKSKDSLEDFSFLSQINEEFGAEEKTKTTSTEKKTEITKPKKKGRNSGFFIQEVDAATKAKVTSISIFKTLHSELHDLVYLISKQHQEDGKDRVSMLGVSTKAIELGIKQLKKKYNLE